MANEIAGLGQVFVCGACGKRSMDRYGDKAIDRGWDASCMSNSTLCADASIELDPETGRVVKADAVGAGAPK